LSPDFIREVKDPDPGSQIRKEKLELSCFAELDVLSVGLVLGIPFFCFLESK
jgi:hypothetical protein